MLFRKKKSIPASAQNRCDRHRERNKTNVQKLTHLARGRKVRATEAEVDSLAHAQSCDHDITERAAVDVTTMTLSANNQR